MYEDEDVQNRYSPLGYFLMTFPMEQLQLCLKKINKIIRKNRIRETNTTDFYNLFGIVASMTGMFRQRFNDLRNALRWSHQPKDRPDGLFHAEHRWMFIHDMVDIFEKRLLHHLIELMMMV